MRKVRAGRKSRSLQRGAFRAVLLSVAFIFLLVAPLVFLFYYYTVMRDYKYEFRNIGAFIMAELDEDYLEDLFVRTQQMYDTMPEEVKSDPFGDAFKSESYQFLDDKYFSQRDILYRCRESTDITNVFIGFFDYENDRLVAVLDGDTNENFYTPGQYINMEDGTLGDWKTIKRVIKSDWRVFVANSPLTGWTATDYMPIYAKNGKMIGVMMQDTWVSEFTEEIYQFLLFFVPLLILVQLFVAVGLTLQLNRRIVQPIKALARAASDYSQFDQVENTDHESFFEKVELSTGDEIEELKETMVNMEGDISRTMEEIRRVSSEKERIATELDIAKDIQMQALSTDFPESDSYAIYASMTPAKEVGGDFYDFFTIDEDHEALVMADVSGKGVPAALFMMRAKEVLRGRALQGGTPAEILAYTNDRLATDNVNCMFVTVWFGILEISSGIITAVNAAHEFPFVTDETGRFYCFEDAHGLACGIMEGTVYEDYTIDLSGGGRIFVYTDGVAEAQKSDGKLFDLERIEATLNRGKDGTPKELAEMVKDEVDAFVGDDEQFDDITMMTLQIFKKC